MAQRIGGLPTDFPLIYWLSGAYTEEQLREVVRWLSGR